MHSPEIQGCRKFLHTEQWKKSMDMTNVYSKMYKVVHQNNGMLSDRDKIETFDNLSNFPK